MQKSRITCISIKHPKDVQAMFPKIKKATSLFKNCTRENVKVADFLSKQTQLQQIRSLGKVLLESPARSLLLESNTSAGRMRLEG